MEASTPRNLMQLPATDRDRYTARYATESSSLDSFMKLLGALGEGEVESQGTMQVVNVQQPLSH